MKISVIIPVYNVKQYLHKCLDSVLMQTYKDFEIICINDGSTDESLEILEEYAASDQRLQYYSIPNGGQANARNIGIKNAQGEFVCFIDSDDTIEPEMLEKMIRVQEEDQCDLVVCGIERVFDEGSNLLERSFSYDASLKEKHCVTIHEYPEIITVINNSPFSKLIRKDIIQKNEIEFPVGYIYEDMVFTHKLLATGLTISVFKDKCYRYVVRKGSTMTSKKSKVTDMFAAYKMITDYYKTKKIEHEFKNELNYLGLYHVGIGTSYRMFRSKQYGLVKSLKVCKAYLKDNGCDKNNCYIKRKSLMERLFIALFM